MTSKMQSCVDHIKTSLDVDSWATELVEHVFTEYDARFDKVLEIIDTVDNDLDFGTKEKCVALSIKEKVLDLKGGEQ